MAGDIAFITGATGFVGSAVARELLRAGIGVRALVRRSSPHKNLDGLDIETVEGNMRDQASMRQAAKSARYVFHVAADYRLWAPDPDEIMRANIEGTRSVMEAARDAGVERVVYTSSVATLKLHENGTPADEAEPLSEDEAIGAYKKSKVAAERLVERMVGEGLPAVIVNPSTPIGPRDVRPTPTGRIIIEAATGRMPVYVDTGLNVVHVDDVAAGHIAALRHGRIGERYILGGENMSLADLLRRIARSVGRSPPTIRIPRELIYPVAIGAEALARLTGKEPFVTLDGLRLAKYRMYFSSAKAGRELGYKSRPADEGIRDAIDWFRQAGMLS
ncbi:MAG TPA: hopanoid-associated sugar epimerase [Methyloceanibacter sp.]|nr:hopanoid-associated sugar epimerase [Methyloceanibacter sp.]